MRIAPRRGRIGAVLGVGILIGLVLAAGRSGERSVYEANQVLMGSFSRISVIPDSEENRQTVRRVFAYLARLEQTLSNYDPGSELSRVNAAAMDGPVIVSDTLLAVISAAARFSAQTGGAFDMTATSLRQPGGYKHIHLDAQKRTVYSADPRARIDLGGITVGFALDEAARILRDAGIEHFLLDIGGDIYCAGRNSRGRPWQVGITDPAMPGRSVYTLQLSDQATTTSGNYIKQHIVATTSTETAPVSITVVAQTGMAADALATAVFAMNREQRRAFVRSQPQCRFYEVYQQASRYAVRQLR